MISITRKLALTLVISAVMAGCSKPDEVNTMTPEQKAAHDRLFDMGQPTDRSKSKGF